MRKKYLHLLIALVIVVLSLSYAFKDVSLRELGTAFSSMHAVYLLPALFMVAMSYLFRAMRWRHLVSSVKKVRTKDLFSPLMVGFMANMLPARAGEFIRAYLLGKKERISFSASFATIFIERLFDMSLVLLLLFWVLLFKTDIFASGDAGANHKLMGYMFKFGWISFAGCMFIFLFSILLQFRNDWAMKAVSVCIRPLPQKWGEKVIKMVESFSNGLQILKNGRGFAATVLLSFLIWGVFVMTYYPIYLAFDIHTELPVMSSLIILCLTVAIFITLFPTPGFLGAFQAACVVALHEIFGISKAVALSYGIVTWAVLMVPTIAVGAIYAIKDHVSLGEFSTAREQIK